MQTQEYTRWASRTRQSCLALILIAKLSAAAQSTAPEILAISPPRGPEGTRITISGKNLIAVSSVLFADTPAVFRSASAERLIAIVPHKVTASSITVITSQGRITSPLPFVVVNDPRIPDEVSYKSGIRKSIAAARQLHAPPGSGESRSPTPGFPATNRQKSKLRGPD